MKNQVIRATAGGFAAAMVAAAVAIPAIPSASATSTGAVPFNQASFNGYATGTELHLGVTALDSLSQITGQNLSSITGLQLNSLDQGFSSASTNSAGLTAPITSELKTIIQPQQPAAVKAFNEGDGIQLNLGGAAGQTLNNLANSLLAAAQQSVPPAAVSLAPPNLAGVVNQTSLSLDPIADVKSLVGEAQANFPQDSCPTGTISYGLGNLTAANLLTGLPSLTSTGVNSAPLISTAGNGTSVSQSKSATSLVSNGDGSYGIQTVASDIIAPISVNLLGLATLQIAVHSAGGVNDPVTLTATTPGGGSGASVVPSTDDILNVQLVEQTPSGPQSQTLANVPLSTIGKDGLHIPISISGLSVLLSQVSLPTIVVQTLQNVLTGLAQVANNSTVTSAINTVIGVLQQATAPVTNVVSTLTTQPTVQQLLAVLSGMLNLNLGSIDVDTVPHAINQPWNVPATTVGGTQASGAMDLLNVHLGLNNSSINIGGQTIPAGTIPGVTQAISVPSVGTVPLPDIALANFVVGHLETASALNQPISCASTSPTAAPPTPQQAPPAPQKLPFTGGPGGLWQPALGIGTLGLGGFSLALVRRLRRRSAV